MSPVDVEPRRPLVDMRLAVAVYLMPLALAGVSLAAYGGDLYLNVAPPALPFYPAVLTAFVIGAATDRVLRGVIYAFGAATVYWFAVLGVVVTQFVADVGSLG